MGIDEKISAYQELISNYEDMEVIERMNCKHYDSVKDMIQEEIQRIKDLKKEIQTESENMIYTYEICYRTSYSHGFEESNNFYKSYEEVCNAMLENLKEDVDNEIIIYKIIKRSFIRDSKEIVEEYIFDKDRHVKQINIYNPMKFTDMDGIWLNIPTPFKKGDMLISYNNSLFASGTFLNYTKNVFVLDWLCNWEEVMKKRLNKDYCDSSDMNGTGYIILEDDKLECDHQFDYDNWEYFEGELKGNQRILKAISNFIKGKIGIDLLLETYKYMLADKEVNQAFWYGYTDEGLKLAGLSDEDIKRVKG